MHNPIKYIYNVKMTKLFTETVYLKFLDLIEYAIIRMKTITSKFLVLIAKWFPPHDF